MCDCELRWYKKWYTSEWQDIDTDYIKDTYCLDPSDKKDHKMSDVDLSHMYCENDKPALPSTDPSSGGTTSISATLFLMILMKHMLIRKLNYV